MFLDRSRWSPRTAEAATVVWQGVFGVDGDEAALFREEFKGVMAWFAELDRLERTAHNLLP